MGRFALPFLLAGSLLAQDPSADFIRAKEPGAKSGPMGVALERLDASRIARHMAWLVDPRREGRGLGTRGLNATVHDLKDQLQAMGIPPLGTSPLQAVPLREVRPGKGTIRLRTASHLFTFHAGQDAILPAVEPGVLSGPVVFAGHGIQEPSLGHDDFRGLEVRGRIVAFLDGLPPGEPWKKPELIERYASPRPADRYDHRLALLEKLGARAAIALEAGLDQRIREGKEPPLPYFLAARGLPRAGEPPLARVALTAELRQALETGQAETATLSIRGREKDLLGFNVLGRLEGSDPVLRQEAILIGAHMDHLGQPNGVLHPGADDNASGVAALLEIARAFASSPVRPRRTLLFAFWTGEEEGKFGSGHYTRHPRWPLATTRAYLNLDMIGHPWTLADLQALAAEAKAPAAFLDGLDPTRFAEPGLSSAHRDLGPVLSQAGLDTGLSLHLDWTDGRNGGSDYRDFARLGLPFVRFFGSYFPEYHKPGDTLDKLDPDQVKRMARLVLATAWLLADR
ncbi:MAG: M20/M25/M40 family metallo-hydrolase [Geothrix sp.]|uniref:M20/M25/M40 family metallo-hydrolase n=1 Tax=Geothrix sp. TaxID=1962974 RepID=UPI00185A237F|nr:M20/M25/M40 family metallo-hydrolase [Geothrix sp.]NWJ41935.1 M20/M25/M40 family metallo-hydrolase [Geothrix sp.]WIL20092.1 MAG: M20/M25/M40 family metallo-hydrolase [Geothrix sp.]